MDTEMKIRAVDITNVCMLIREYLVEGNVDNDNMSLKRALDVFEWADRIVIVQ